jgi:hypothetical protein
MPANLSPESEDAQHLQAEIKTRIKELTDELGGPKKGAVRGDGTVLDVAQRVHRGGAADLKFARVWGPSVEFDGQRVSASNAVRDRDVVELHW